MARRNDHSRDELKQLAIECGREIIMKEGYIKFSARKAAKNMSYAVGTLYNIFDNSNDLIMHINASTMDLMKDFIIQRIDPKLEGEEALKNLAFSYIIFAKENYHLWSSLFEFNLPKDTPCPDWYVAKISNLTGLVERALLPLLKDDETEAARMAEILWAGVHGICQMALTGKIDRQSSELIESLVSVFISHYIKGIEA